jgi:hypothetical protein
MPFCSAVPVHTAHGPLPPPPPRRRAVSATRPDEGAQIAGGRTPDATSSQLPGSTEATGVGVVVVGVGATAHVLVSVCWPAAIGGLTAPPPLVVACYVLLHIGYALVLNRSPRRHPAVSGMPRCLSAYLIPYICSIQNTGPVFMPKRPAANCRY